MLEEKIGRDEVLKRLEAQGVKQNVTDYPKNAEWILEFRKKVYAEIMDFFK